MRLWPVAQFQSSAFGGFAAAPTQSGYEIHTLSTYQGQKVNEKDPCLALWRSSNIVGNHQGGRSIPTYVLTYNSP